MQVGRQAYLLSDHSFNGVEGRRRKWMMGSDWLFSHRPTPQLRCYKEGALRVVEKPYR